MPFTGQSQTKGQAALLRCRQSNDVDDRAPRGCGRPLRLLQGNQPLHSGTRLPCDEKRCGTLPPRGDLSLQPREVEAGLQPLGSGDRRERHTQLVTCRKIVVPTGSKSGGLPGGRDRHRIQTAQTGTVFLDRQI